MLTCWYWSPRESGGDCHQRSDPSIAYSIGWFSDGLLGPQCSHDRPWIESFPGTVANLQYNSSSLTLSPHVEVASIFLPCAMLMAGELNICPKLYWGAKQRAKTVCKAMRTNIFSQNGPHTNSTTWWNQIPFHAAKQRRSNYLGGGEKNSRTSRHLQHNLNSCKYELTNVVQRLLLSRLACYEV